MRVHADDMQFSGRADSQVVHIANSRFQCRAPISRVFMIAVPGNCGDNALGIYFADHVIGAIGDI